MKQKQAVEQKVQLEVEQCPQPIGLVQMIPRQAPHGNQEAAARTYKSVSQILLESIETPALVRSHSIQRTRSLCFERYGNCLCGEG